MSKLVYIFQCKKCNLTVTKESSSSPQGMCPRGGTHSWTVTTTRK